VSAAKITDALRGFLEVRRAAAGVERSCDAQGVAGAAQLAPSAGLMARAEEIITVGGRAEGWRARLTARRAAGHPELRGLSVRALGDCAGAVDPVHPCVPRLQPHGAGVPAGYEANAPAHQPLARDRDALGVWASNVGKLVHCAYFLRKVRAPVAGRC
jgi:hypothetical protein